ncbi:MAG: hypothetical protein AD742_10670 [Methylibium sp. NZG]|nr:MAG: hypothetical protein AD742_10670 [Methylibium sp. NZG]
MLTPARLPLLLAAIASLALGAAVAYDLHRERNLAIQQTRSETANLASLLEAHARSNLRHVEVMLAEANVWVDRVPEPARPGNSVLRNRLEALRAADRLVRGFLLVDARGAVQISTLASDAEFGDLTEGIGAREWFATSGGAEQRPGLVVGAVEKTRVGRWALPVSRPVTAEAGSDAGTGGGGGVLVAVLDLATIQPVLNAVDTGANGFVTLFLEQGWLIATAPVNEELFKRNWKKTPLFEEHLPRSAVGTVQQVVVRDNTERVYSYRRLGDYPVVVSIGKSLTDALADWRQRLAWNVALLLATSGALMAAAAALSNHYRRREAAELALAESAQQTRAIVDHAADGIVTFDRHGKIESVNLAGEAIFGRSASALVGRNVAELVPELATPGWPATSAGFRSGGRFEVQGRRSDDSSFPVDMSVTEVARGREPVYVALIRDATDSKQVQTVIVQAREHAERQERFLREVTDNVPLRIAYADRELRYQFVNKAHCERFGLPREAIIGRTRQELTQQPNADAVRAELQAVLRGEARRFEYEERVGDRHAVIESALVPDVAPDGTVRGFYSASADVTERHRQQRRIELALAERETLLREVYHRVKNNLQIIQSLLNLQRRGLPDGVARAALADSVERVRAMALVHEKLYQHGSLSAISLREYTHDLLVQIGEAAGAHRRGITLRAEVDAVEAALDVSVPYGLLVAELVSNSLKHAFADDRGGEVCVVLKRDGETISLEVRDNGIGLPAGFDLEQPQSMGLQLAASLAEQLGGTLAASNRGGAVFTASLPRLA